MRATNSIRVPLCAEVMVALRAYALENNLRPETVIAEAVRAYLGMA